MTRLRTSMTVSTVARRETALRGGTMNAGLVSRVGDTVRRPTRPTMSSTRALLDHLEAVGFAGAPRHLGVDERGREVLSYIPGRAPIAPTPAWALGDEALVSVAQLLRRYHDAVASFDPSAYEWTHPVPDRFCGYVVCHNDPNLDNVIFRAGRAIALIDFDLAAPGSRVWDLACTARLWVPLREDADMPPQVRGRAFERLSLFADAYGATPEQRVGTIDALAECHAWCYSIVRSAVADGHSVFSRQWRHGAGLRAERTGRWLSACAPQMRAALGVDR